MLSLKNVMRANATSCLAFGALFVLQPNLVANFLSVTSPAPKSYILILGILLILNGLHLLWASRVPLPQKKLILYFSTSDYIWVIGSSRANYHRSMDYNYRWGVASEWCCSHGWAFWDSSNDKQKSDGALLDIIEQEGIHNASNHRFGVLVLWLVRGFTKQHTLNLNFFYSL